MTTVLDRIKAYKLEDVAARKLARPLAAIEADARAAPPPRGFAAALRAVPRDHSVCQYPAWVSSLFAGSSFTTGLEFHCDACHFTSKRDTRAKAGLDVQHPKAE